MAGSWFPSFFDYTNVVVLGYNGHGIFYIFSPFGVKIMISITKTVSRKLQSRLPGWPFHQTFPTNTPPPRLSSEKSTAPQGNSVIGFHDNSSALRGHRRRAL